jgi:acetoin utilization protein AcuB
MTSKPYTIERGASFAEARALMHGHHIRHVPVVDRGELCGIVSLRDLALYEAGGADPASARIDLVMVDSTFIVTSDAPLDDVAEIMAEHKYGSVVVMGRDGVEGIFTAVDACKALAAVLRKATLDLG